MNRREGFFLYNSRVSQREVVALGSCVWTLRDNSGVFTHMAVPVLFQMCTIACMNITFCCKSMTFCFALGVKSVCKYVCIIACIRMRMEVMQGVGSQSHQSR